LERKNLAEEAIQTRSEVVVEKIQLTAYEAVDTSNEGRK
jgi:hypothetical protein